MIASTFNYHKPSTLREASETLTLYKNSMIMGGGTDLIVRMRNGTQSPENVVDVKGIDELNKIYWDGEGLFIGAAISITQVKNNTDVKERFPALHQASCVFGCSEIRNRATIGGNLCNASPGAETAGPLLIYNSTAKIWSEGKIKSLPLSDFFTAPGRTALKHGEILTGVTIPTPPAGALSSYRRAARVKGQDLATCAISVMIVNPKKLQEREIRIALSAVMKTPSRARELEKILSGRAITPEVLTEAKNWMRNNLYPRASSLRGTPDYKKDVLCGMLEIILSEFGVLG